jgi:hypothetical protein
LQQLRNWGKVYNSAMIDAMDANEGLGENMLPRTELFGVHYPNLLIPVGRADEWQASGEHVDGACLQVALKSCRLPETVRLIYMYNNHNMQADSATPVDCHLTHRAFKFQ